MMIDKDSLDPFTYHLIKRIDPKVLDSLTPNQLSAIIEAAQATRHYAKHPIDIRGVIPLFFARFYFVFLMGRDRRARIRHEERRRWEWTSLLAWTVFLFIVSFPFLVLFFMLFYFFKSSLGIDIMPDYHLADFINLR